MKKTPVSILCGIAAILLTVILYFVILGNAFVEVICFLTLIGVVFAEIVTTALACFAKDNPRRVAAAGMSALMIPVAIILSIVYIINFPYGYSTYLAWYFAAYIVIGIISVIILNFDSKRGAQNQMLQDAKNNILNMRKIVKLIMAIPGTEQYREKLNEIEEKLHFSNDSVISEYDEKISAMLTELKQNITTPEYDVVKAMTDICLVIDERNILINNNI